MRTRVLDTALGPVEVVLTPGLDEPVVLVFPGGHTTAATPLGADLYGDLGYRVLTFSRPGYGRSRVGSLTALEFVPAVMEVCQRLRIAEAAATVGVSLGGLQAVHVAVALPHLAPRLVLHSCAPSSLPYPNKVLERLGAPLVFGPHVQRLTWQAVRAATSSDRGLRLMMASLSTLPTAQWWDDWSPADRAAARATFSAMESGSGFVNDLRQARPDTSLYRAKVLRSVRCPTLITASRYDRGVSFEHAQDFEGTIPRTRLVETDAPSHFYWLGTERRATSDAIKDFMTPTTPQADDTHKPN